MAQEPDINIGAIAEQLNGKVDTDVGNVNHDGSTVIANYAMPSSSFDNLTLQSSGTFYTAPADGWFFLDKVMNSGEYVNMLAYTSDESTFLYKTTATFPTNSGSGGVIIPIAKGFKVRINYTASGNVATFRFIYAKGSEPQS